MNVMALVAHADDETLGAGGYISRLVTEGNEVAVVILSNCIVPGSMRNDNKANALKACQILNIRPNNVHFLGLEDQQFDRYPILEINRSIEELNLHPDLIITHAPTDVNKDHRITFESALVVGRSIKKQINILSCEVLSSSEWGDAPFHANYYVNIESTLDLKLRALEAYQYELRSFPHPRSLEAVRYKAYQRGMEVGWKAAEAYNVVRWFKR